MIPFHETAGYLMVTACKAHRNALAAALAELGLYVGQEMLLMTLWGHDGVSQSDLGTRLGVEPPTVSKALDRMERGGLVSRRPDPTDARAVCVYLTERGRALEEPVRRVLEEIEARSFAGFTLEERLLLRRLLQQIHQNLS